MIADKNLLTPPPYFRALIDFVKNHESEMWNWLSSAEAQADYSEELRLDLLKSTYRLSPESHGAIYQLADRAKRALGLDIPITIYQSQQSTSLNASIFYLPNEGHIVFSGNILQLLKEQEILSVLAHELGHYHLWNREKGLFHILDRLVSKMVQSPRVAPSHLNTARYVQLYTEIYCDRASWLATQDVCSIIGSLLKIQTGFSDADPESYLKQTEEVFQKQLITTEQMTHPETFIRAKALELWVAEPIPSEVAVSKMVEGSKGVDDLDLLGQKELAEHTKILINELLQPEWFQTTSVLAHARLFFEDFEILKKSGDRAPTRNLNSKTQEYFGYILLDFSVMDPDLEDEPLKQAMRVAKSWGIEESFGKLVQKELKLKSKAIEKLLAEK